MAQTDKKISAADKPCLTIRVRMGKDTYGPGDEWRFASHPDVTDATLENLRTRKILTGDWDALRAKIASGEPAPPVENPLTDADKDTAIAELEQEIAEAQEAYDGVKAERDRAQQAVEVAKEAATHLHDTLEERTAERNAALAQVDSLNGQLATVRADRDTQAGIVVKVTLDLENAQSALVSLQAAFDTLKAEQGQASGETPAADGPAKPAGKK